jgi:hypothetical protein
VSPQNILVGVDGLARVLDFGVAKARGRLQTTRDGQIKGKLAYMAPEQIRRGEVTRTSDVFSAGVVLWEALTGKRLFSGENEGHVISLVLDAPIAAPSTVRPEIDPVLDAIVLRALDRDPDRRWATARELALAIEQNVDIAPPSMVGTWVRGTATQVLEERALRVAAIERGTSAAVGTRAVGPDETTRTDAGVAAASSPSRSRRDVEVTRTETHAIELQPAIVRAAPSSTRRFAVAVVALAAVGALGWLGLSALRDAPSRIGAQEPGAAASGAASTGATERIAIDIITDPPGAIVVALGGRHGPTPTSVEIARGEAPIEISIEREGFEPLARSIVPDRDQRLELRLTTLPGTSASDRAEPSGATRPASPQRPRPAPSSAPAAVSSDKPGPYYRFE